MTFIYKYDRSNRLLEEMTPDKDFDIYNPYGKDGNILTLDRNGSTGNSLDDFNYSYYSGTNKLSKVTGSVNQYTYDANGNMTKDDLNKNFEIIYDYRNLIVQLKQLVIEVHGSRNDSTIYKTYYYYDESGNRIRKKIYNDKNDSLLKDIVYSRDVSGKELAIYENENIKQWNIWGTDNAGFITGEGDKRYYLKDHLGSIRAVIDDGGSLISAQDYDAWGYQLQDRNYDSNVSIYKFTSKEHDGENKYDYFGARYYDARVGRWGQVDQMSEKRFGISPYSFVQDNPLKYIDPNGLLDRPIYDTEGNFLGTDDEGLQGEAIIMNSENFKQGMSVEAALNNNLGIEGLNGVDAQNKFTDHYNSLKGRPDYDGYLTLEDANEWYRSGNGQSLYTSLEKIDLSGIYSLGEGFVGQEKAFNLLLNSNNLNDALVYGTITLKRYPNNTVRAYNDQYDFIPNDWNNPLNYIRNLSTLGGQIVAGVGIPYDINIYGSKTLTPIFPGIK
jgi:RHS repeat-associated protein